MNKYHIYTITFLFLISCSEKKESHNYKIFKETDLESINISSTKKSFDEILNPSKVEIIENYLFILESNRGSLENPPIHVIDTKSWSYYRAKGIRGTGPLELAGAQVLFEGKSSDSFWAYSSQDKKFLEFNLHDSSRLANNEYRQPSSMFKVVRISPLSDTSYLGISVENKHRLIEFSKDGVELNSYGEWEKVSQHPYLDFFDLFRLNDGWFKGNSRYKIYAHACIFRDRLEIFDYQTKEFITVDGPDLELPTFKMMGKDNSASLYIPLEENRYRYRDLTITSSYIFALYGGIGEFEFRETSVLAKKIYVFTHTGKPLVQLNLDRSIEGIVVNETTNQLYGLTTDENPGIAVFNLPLIE
ncbi:putative lipoprotein [Lunatimonas lonarensis]|uniref:Putative lipoprotein n=1 Tax=Lunatimonas lonarensis TaxID=1232681 RepID=R7ZX27_9BACT|nr:BF3164 family lipoprotein [Lunatimonas lonarensis]EON78720.1 putative lipoprotein [Lunatimonas lonarensis]